MFALQNCRKAPFLSHLISPIEKCFLHVLRMFSMEFVVREYSCLYSLIFLGFARNLCAKSLYNQSFVLRCIVFLSLSLVLSISLHFCIEISPIRHDGSGSTTKVLTSPPLTKYRLQSMLVYYDSPKAHNNFHFIFVFILISFYFCFRFTFLLILFHF